MKDTMMRTTLIARTLALGLVLAPVAMVAQQMQSDGQQAPPDQPAAAAPQGNHGNPAERQQHMLKALTKRLNLTPDQVSQVQGIQNDSMTQMQGLRSDSSIAPADRRSKMMDIHKTEQEKIRAVLNDEQKPKYDAMVAHQQQRMHEHQQEDNAPAQQ